MKKYEDLLSAWDKINGQTVEIPFAPIEEKPPVEQVEAKPVIAPKPQMPTIQAQNQDIEDQEMIDNSPVVQNIPMMQSAPSRSESIMEEYRKLVDTSSQDLQDAKNKDLAINLIGNLGDNLTTYLNAAGEKGAKTGAGVQRGAGAADFASKLADEAATQNAINKQRVDALLEQYRQMSLGERALMAQQNQQNIARERNQAMLDAARARGQGSGLAADRFNLQKEQIEYKKIENLQNGFNKDKQVIKAEERIQSAQTLKELVNGNPITQEAAKTFAAKASGEVGALSDQDRAAYGGSKAILSKLNSAINQAATGELTEENKKFMNELAVKFEQAGQRDLSARLNLYTKQASKRIQLPESEIREIIRPTIDEIQPDNTPSTIIRLDPKTNRKVEYDAVTKKPIRYVD